MAEYGPEVPVPVIGDEAALPSRYDRAAAERRAADAQRQLDRLGKVNPLALEEYAALTERHAFLATQLDDLRKTRRDLLTVVKEVDDRVQEVFASAYADTAREFEQLFARLFPGGQGNLVLTEPDDMLATGIEIEARPPGKKVKRLSLLSGGERSLTAIAYLFAIFKARPSPFYVLDEVEAALDDTNLQRLLRRLRGTAGELPAHRHHPPAPDDGSRRRPLRHHHARRRRLHRHQPAPRHPPARLAPHFVSRSHPLARPPPAGSAPVPAISAQRPRRPLPVPAPRIRDPRTPAAPSQRDAEISAMIRLVRKPWAAGGYQNFREARSSTIFAGRAEKRHTGTIGVLC